MAHRNICRVCSSKVATDDEAYNLLELPELAEKFSDCTNLVVDPMEHEMMPSELCCECYEQLEKFHAFRALCILTDHRWRSQKWLGQRGIERGGPALDVDEIFAGQVLTRDPQGTEFIVCGVAKVPASFQGLTASQRADNMPLFKCSVCDEEFELEKRLLTHMQEHEGHSLYHCTEPGCEATFNRYETLKQHEAEHAKEGTRFVCNQNGCSKIYRHRGSLQSHLRRAHEIGKPVKTHICEFCGRVFKNLAALTHHRFTHGDSLELPFACEDPDCALKFPSQEKLRVHMMRHNGVKNYSCPYCGLRKTTKNELRLHINYHTLERTWSCAQCSKVCNSSTSLKKHFRAIHEKARDYACSYCERSFATAHTRKYHEMTHTGEKNFECHECGKRFTQPAALRTHRKVHEREEQNLQPTLTIATCIQEVRLNV